MEEEGAYRLHWLDYILFVAMLAVSMGIGLFVAFYGKRRGEKTTTKEYLTGDRKLAMFPASVSIVVSYMSAISMLGDPAETYMYGAMWMWQLGAGVIGAVLASLLFVPVFYPLQLTSINKYFELRYGSPYPKFLGAISNILMSMTYTGIVIYAPATAIAIILDLPIWLIVIVCAVVAILYTALGGLKAVIWTDVFQACCMLVGITTIFVTAIVKVGGLSEAFSIAKEGGRLNFINVSFDPTTRLTLWNTLLGSSLSYSLVFGTTQAAVMRYSGMTSLRNAKNSVYIVMIGNTVIYVLPLLAGLGIFAFYTQARCDPIKGALIESPNQLVTYFFMETLDYPGVPGMFVASLCAGSLSSVSSVLNAASAITWDDLISPRFPAMPEWKGTAICKALVFVYGVCAVAVSFVTMNLGGTVLQASLSFNNAISVPCFGMVLFGCLCPWINWKGALVGGITGFVLVFWLALGSYSVEKFVADILPMATDGCDPNATLSQWFLAPEAPTTSAKGLLLANTLADGMTSLPDDVTSGGVLQWLYGISFMWYIHIGLVVIFIVASVVSVCTGCSRDHEIDPNLLFPCIRGAYVRRMRKKVLALEPMGENTENDVQEKFVKKDAVTIDQRM